MRVLHHNRELCIYFIYPKDIKTKFSMIQHSREDLPIFS